MDTINVKIAFLNEPFKVNIVKETTTVEDVIIEICKRLNIGPVARLLFALQHPKSQTWLPLSSLISEGETTDFDFALRFGIPNTDRLKDIDEYAYDFYFRQARYTIHRSKIPSSEYEAHKSEIIGLGVIDMFRATIEDGRTKQEVINEYKKYIPRMAKRKHRIFLKTPILNKYNEIKLKNVNVAFVKSGYLGQFHKIVPRYLTEEFRGVVNTDKETVYEVQLRISPFDKELPGIGIKYENKGEWEHLCTIDGLCYLTKDSDGTVLIYRKNGVPLYVKFHTLAAMTSFITALDGYYRLMVKWTFNLCSDYVTPSLVELRRLKCHGPVSGEFAYRKLIEKRNNKPGCFILRESDLAYNTYYIDICSKKSKPITFKIVKTKSETYKLAESQNEYPSLWHLIKEEKWEDHDTELKECLPPSEFDQSNLLLCQVENSVYTKNQSSPKDEGSFSLGIPACIDSRTLMVFKNMPRDGRSPFTIVYRSVWRETQNTKRDVAIKILRDNFHQQRLTEFLLLTSRWAFVNAGAVVKLYGATLSNPVSMVMEYLPYGQLDAYLSNPQNRSQLTEMILVEASVALANALYYMELAGFVHGCIRCRKLLIAEHTDEKFIVKLADPGLYRPYQDKDLHWIPPEHHNNPIEARSSVNADVWAFATTLWEIFSYGNTPSPDDAETIKSFYANPTRRLPMPNGCPRNIYYLMLDCWHHDVDSRIKPQTIFRDINQIFYQVYNFPKNNSYASIIPKPSIDQDNVSQKSKISEEFSTCAQSETTENTTLENDFSSGRRTADTSITYQPPCTLLGLNTNNLEDFPKNSETSISSMQSIFELDKEWNLVLQGRIGEGFYGEVYAGRLLHMYSDEEQKVAVKKMKNDNFITISNYRDFQREIKIMKDLKHPNIVTIKGFMTEPDCCLVLEYIEHHSLLSYLPNRKERLTPHHLLKFALDVARGMTYLSEKRIVHRDLAARNILVVSESHVKISDFGLARFIGQNSYYTFETTRKLPLKWYAPESIEELKFSPQSDVWSYGVTLFEMFSFAADPKLPSVGDSPTEIMEALKQGVRLPMPPKCPQYIYANIMIPCWSYDASSRPTFDKLCESIEEICPFPYM